MDLFLYKQVWFLPTEVGDLSAARKRLISALMSQKHVGFQRRLCYSEFEEDSGFTSVCETSRDAAEMGRERLEMTNCDNRRATGCTGRGAAVKLSCATWDRHSRLLRLCLAGDALLSFPLISSLHHSSEALQTPSEGRAAEEHRRESPPFSFSQVLSALSSLDSHLPRLRLQRTTDWAPDQNSDQNSRRQTCLAVTERIKECPGIDGPA